VNDPIPHESAPTTEQPPEIVGTSSAASSNAPNAEFPLEPEPGEPLMVVRQVVREFAVKKSDPVTVLRGIDMDVKRGEILAIVGASGAGKSTLLHCMGMLDRPTRGQILLRGEELAHASSARRDWVRNVRIGFVFQAYHLLPEFTAMENVVLPAMIAAGWKWPGVRGTVRKRATELLERMSLPARIGTQRPATLSGGEKQRVAIARALINSPELVLCDEPTGNLDSATGETIYELILDLNNTLGHTFVLVTHNEPLAARAHRTIVVHDGLVQGQATGQLAASPA
jgi:lipoprotein-releasing system ATP-binding protein